MLYHPDPVRNARHAAWHAEQVFILTERLHFHLRHNGISGVCPACTKSTWIAEPSDNDQDVVIKRCLNCGHIDTFTVPDVTAYARHSVQPQMLAYSETIYNTALRTEFRDSIADIKHSLAELRAEILSPTPCHTGECTHRPDSDTATTSIHPAPSDQVAA